MPLLLADQDCDLTATRATRQAVNRLEADNPTGLNVMGSVVDFDYRVVGYRGHPLSVRWTAFDSQTDERLGQSQEFDLLPLRFRAEKKDGDLGSWEIWVNGNIAQGRSVFLMIDLYDDSAGARLTYLVTDRFVLA